jgi:hypothetical protein
MSISPPRSDIPAIWSMLAMDMAGALSGRPRAPAPDGLRPLPALELRDGRLSFGPIRLPAPPIPPLY